MSDVNTTQHTAVALVAIDIAKRNHVPVEVAQGFVYKQTYFLKDELSIVKPFNYNGLSKKKTSNDVFFKELLVGTAGFEPTTPCPPGRCATKLRYAPI